MYSSPYMALRVLARHPCLYFSFPNRSSRAPDMCHEFTVGLLRLITCILSYVILALYTHLYPYLTDITVVSPQPRYPYIEK